MQLRVMLLFCSLGSTGCRSAYEYPLVCSLHQLLYFFFRTFPLRVCPPAAVKSTPSLISPLFTSCARTCSLVKSAGIEGTLSPKYFARVGGVDDFISPLPGKTSGAAPRQTPSETSNSTPPQTVARPGRWKPAAIDRGEQGAASAGTTGGAHVHTLLDFEATCEDRDLDGAR